MTLDLVQLGDPYRAGQELLRAVAGPPLLVGELLGVRVAELSLKLDPRWREPCPWPCFGALTVPALFIRACQHLVDDPPAARRSGGASR